MTDDAGRKASPLTEGLGLAPERAAFEAWFSEGGKWPAAVHRSGDGYALAAAQAAWTAYKVAWDYQQAEIDRLMLEWCPDEMTPRQMAEWAKHQRKPRMTIAEAGRRAMQDMKKA